VLDKSSSVKSNLIVRDSTQDPMLLSYSSNSFRKLSESHTVQTDSAVEIVVPMHNVSDLQLSWHAAEIKIGDLSNFY
jgi:hypothetical protein